MFALSENHPISIAQLDDGTRVLLSNGHIITESSENGVFESDPEELPDPPEAPEPARATSTKISKSSKSRAATSPVAKVPQVGAGTSVLIMQEPGDPETSGAELQTLHQRLLTRGYSVVSGVVPEDPNALDFAMRRYVDLAGSLRTAVGLRQLQSTEAREVVRDWFEHPRPGSGRRLAHARPRERAIRRAQADFHGYFCAGRLRRSAQDRGGQTPLSSPLRSTGLSTRQATSALGSRVTA